MRAIKVLKIAAAARITADGNGSAVDLNDYGGEGILVLNASATEAAGNTLDVKIQHSDDGSTGWADSGVSFTQVTNAAASHQVKFVNVDQFKRYIRAVDDIGGSTPAVTRAIELIAKKVSP